MTPDSIEREHDAAILPPDFSTTCAPFIFLVWPSAAFDSWFRPIWNEFQAAVHQDTSTPNKVEGV